MCVLIYVLLGILTFLYLPVERESLALAASNSQNTDIKIFKANFSTPVVDSLLKFPGFRRKFEVPYLGVTTALKYAKEIAKATAFSPLFSNSDGVEEFATKYLLRMVLPSSPDYCSDLNCTASTIGTILAEIATGGGFVTNRVTEKVLQAHAGNLAGNILWRLSRLPDPDIHIVIYLREASIERIREYARLLRLLAVEIDNSNFVADFISNRGINDEISSILSSSICGSSFLHFRLSLQEVLSREMAESYNSAKMLLEYNNPKTNSYIISSIVAETIVFNIIKQGYLRGGEDLEETSYDILKLIKLGIITNRMQLGAKSSFIKHSPEDDEDIFVLPTSVQQDIIKATSNSLFQSNTFQILFNKTQIPLQNLETYALLMAEGASASLPSPSKGRVRTIALALKRILLAVALDKNTSRDKIRQFADDVSKALVDVIMQNRLVKFNHDPDLVSKIFNQMVQSILIFLERHIGNEISPSEGGILDMWLNGNKSLSAIIADSKSTISSFFASIFGNTPEF